VHLWVSGERWPWLRRAPMAGWSVGEGVGYARDRSEWEVEDARSLFGLLWATEIRTRAALRVIK
jgi:hypothetical protein